MKIIIFEAEGWEQEAFSEFQKTDDIVLLQERLSPKNVQNYSDAEIISTFIYSDLQNEILSQLPKLKLIATRSTGFDHIDTQFCREHDIAITNVPEYGENTVAEHVFALLLGLSHKLVEAAERTRRGDFTLAGLQGFDLFDKTLGVIGTGNIGQCVIKIARGFGMKVVAFDVHQDKSMAEELNFEYLPLNDLLQRSDILTLHVPANEHTHHLISDEQFALMKEGVILINTSRGSVINIEALVRALAVGKVAAAGLDVLPDEPTIREESELLHSFYHEQHNLKTLLADSVLLRLRNVIITPHSAFYTKGAIYRIINTTIDNIKAFTKGKPQNLIE
jgi:D-lactate dehydrogenase